MKSSLKVVTTPMCEEIVKIAGIKEYTVSKNPESVKADIAIVLSETELSINSIKIQVNTFTQIKKSIDLLEKEFGTVQLDYKIKNVAKPEDVKIRNIKIKVYSNFLKDIVEDMGFNIVEEDYDFVVYPDYMRDKINELEDNIKIIEIPSHKDVPLNPIKRAEMRYNILEKELCMKP
ncbi:MAG: hypothetical protein ACXVHT_06020 [Methanobacterium sp.]